MSTEQVGAVKEARELLALNLPDDAASIEHALFADSIERCNKSPFRRRSKIIAEAYARIPALLRTLADETQTMRQAGLSTGNTGLFCNGCGSLIEGWPNVFRCVTPNCGRIYHEQCLLTHCAKETADLIKERDRLKEDLRILTEGVFVQSRGSANA